MMNNSHVCSEVEISPVNNTLHLQNIDHETYDCLYSSYALYMMHALTSPTANYNLPLNGIWGVTR